jgi:DNA replication protein DnaC
MDSPPISAELKKQLRALKLSPMLQTLPERLLLARQRQLPHEDFLELVLSDESQRRSQLSTQRRVRRSMLDPSMVVEAWDDSANVTFDRQLWAELQTLRFMNNGHNVLILGPVGVGKTFMANALAFIACRRGISALMIRTDKMLKQLRASRLDHTYDQELRKYIAVDLLVLDDFGIDQLQADESRDIYEIIFERHRSGSTIVTSNRDPQEWLATMTDPLRAQSAIDRFKNAAYELVVEGESYRKRQKPAWGAHNAA